MKQKFKKDGTQFRLNIYGIITVITLLILTIGYAAFSDNLTISGTVATVKPDINIKITSVTATGNNGATVGVTDHGYKYISSSVTMPQSSTVTYTIEVTNFGNEPMAIYAINQTYSPNDLKIVRTTDYNVGDKICSNSNPSQCTGNGVRHFTIEIGYDSYGGTQAHEINLDFEFVRTYDITYSHITNNNYPSVAYMGKPFQATFTGDVPSELLISPTHTYTYNNGVLSIPSVTSDITINRYYSITYNLNSGTQAQNQVTRYLYGDNLTILSPTRSNYQFQGWYENPQFTGSAISSTNGLSRNLTLYAKWGAIYSVTYVDITGSGSYPSTIVSGDTYSQTFTNPPSNVTVTMGGNTLTAGTDYTYSNGTLSIPNVTGNLVITSVASVTPITDLRAGDHIIYVDANGVDRECVILWDSTSSYGIQAITTTVTEQFEIGNGTGSTTAVYNSGSNAAKFTLAVNSRNNARQNLNTAARAYVNTSLSPTNGARVVGSPPNNPDVENAQLTSTQYTYINDYNVKQSDTLYTTDVTQMQSLSIVNVSADYWLGSLDAGSVGKNSTLVGVRYVSSGGSGATYMRFVTFNKKASNSTCKSYTYGLRPVFTLKNTLTVHLNANNVYEID